MNLRQPQRAPDCRKVVAGQSSNREGDGGQRRTAKAAEPTRHGRSPYPARANHPSLARSSSSRRRSSAGVSDVGSGFARLVPCRRGPGASSHQVEAATETTLPLPASPPVAPARGRRLRCSQVGPVQDATNLLPPLGRPRAGKGVRCHRICPPPPEQQGNTAEGRKPTGGLSHGPSGAARPSEQGGGVLLQAPCFLEG